MTGAIVSPSQTSITHNSLLLPNLKYRNVQCPFIIMRIGPAPPTIHKNGRPDPGFKYNYSLIQGWGTDKAQRVTLIV